MKLICFLVLLLPFSAKALELPHNLSKYERQYVVKNLGVASSTKVLANPYPLGGYLGLEVGLSYTYIKTEELSRLGSKNSTEPQLGIADVSIGKGLYDNVDVFFNFSPTNFVSKTSSFGGMVKWGFYQAKFIPLNFSLLVHANTFHLGNQYVNETVGLEVLAGLNVDNIALYVGGGQLHGEGLFVGGSGTDSVLDPTADDIDASTQTSKEIVGINHIYLGLSINVSELFFAVQIDRYDEPILSGKVGIRL